ncbi:sigma-70 family RNA polymerase sigma factor [Actinoplanes hulinensis]|uniref:Sigma-70 family RNA polymerase sigma factor n=2 Tax=Actinoplanes hulinensis TaxID=1144547 RepID=A0ABS7AUP0_9ACTN|nr:sigma-70 family RNA polymerase sigma factor [Actinoplanes hulinensis]MBW6432480.1 sigma-70 family RNA polymerase sigma factor [Actinoplanes hulinensis]
MEDDAALRRIAAGDRAAFQAFYRAHAPWLAARLRRRCADPELAAELLQETFLAVWRVAAGYRGGAQSAGWLWSIALSRLIDSQRRAAVRPHTVVALGDEEHGRHPSAEDEALTRVWDTTVIDALRRLSPELRAVLQATVLDGLSVREAAVLLGVPEGTVKTRAMRARRQLREALS